MPSDDPLTALRNIGPAMAEALTRAGIPSADSLRRIGAHDAYRRMIANGSRPHFIPYYVLHMALQGRPWNDCKGDEKAALRAAYDALISETQDDTAFERMLDEIGVGRRRDAR